MKINVAIIDYGLGNLKSVKNAFNKIGANVVVTDDKETIMNSDIVVLPGVGAFQTAMQNIKEMQLDEIIKEFIITGKPFIGICLGFQLLFSFSNEFGITKGLDLIEGEVLKFPNTLNNIEIKVPQISWNKITIMKENEPSIKGVKNGEFMYFVHSFYAIPKEKGNILTTTNYGGLEYCSSIKFGNIYGFQFHPEKSGAMGLLIYYNIVNIAKGEKWKTN